MLVDLDFKLSKSKHIIGKYKDLVVKMQLQINQKDNKLVQVTRDRDHYQENCTELKNNFK
jgi:hypothetical protein